MIRPALAAALISLSALPASQASAEASRVVLPSGQAVSLMQVLIEEAPPLARFRFLAPEIGAASPARGYDDVAMDFGWLCEHLALPALDAVGLEVPGIVISMSSAPVDFGTTDPDITQFFEPFSLADGICLVEQF